MASTGGSSPALGDYFSSALSNGDIMYQIVRRLPKDEAVGLRLVSRGWRSGYDQQNKSIQLMGCLEDRHFLKRLARGLLERGGRPSEVYLDLWDGSKERRQRATMTILRGFRCITATPNATRSHSNPLLFTSKLSIPVCQLSADVVRSVAAVFPLLREVEAGDESEVDDYVTAAENLVALLGSKGSETDGSGGGSGGEPLLPHLDSLKLPGWEQLPPALATALRHRPQLHSLELKDLEVADPATAQRLGSLTQLRALALMSCNPELIPVLLGQLTGLTHLELFDGTGWENTLHAAELAAQPRLAVLRAPDARLDVRGLTDLTALTRLEVGTFALPPGGPVPQQPVWQLPPGLCSLTLRGFSQSADVLAALVPPACSVTVNEGLYGMRLLLAPGRHIAADGSLLSAGEEALCGAARFLAASAPLERLNVRVGDGDEAEGAEAPPAGMAQAPGNQALQRPPPPSRWLVALAGLQTMRLDLGGMRLSARDLRAMGQHLTTVEALYLGPTLKYPVESVSELARLPSLRDLLLHADRWCGTAQPDPEDAWEEDLALAQQRGAVVAGVYAMYAVGGYEGGVTFFHTRRSQNLQGGGGVEGPPPKLVEMVERLKQLLEDAGLDGGRIEMGPCPMRWGF